MSSGEFELGSPAFCDADADGGLAVGVRAEKEGGSQGESCAYLRAYISFRGARFNFGLFRGSALYYLPTLTKQRRHPLKLKA